MLGPVARWLRILGFDCTWKPDIEDEALVRRAFLEGRIVLSRDHALLEEWRISGAHRVRLGAASRSARRGRRPPRARSGDPTALALQRCNEPLEAAAPGAVEGRIPLSDRERHAALSSCPCCGRVYWEIAHTQRIRRFVDEPWSRAGDRRVLPGAP